jgi:hypothetical protein
MKPITITISGVSIVTPNSMINSDNIIPAMFTMFREKFAENNFNYYSKPEFKLKINNGVQGLSEYKGVIKSFNFDEAADFVDKYNYSLDFVGKPFNASVSGEDKRNEDEKVLNPTTTKNSNIANVNQTKINK